MAVDANLSFLWNAVDFSGNNYNVLLMDYRVPGLPKPRLNVQPLTGADGAVSQGSTFAAGELWLKCYTQAASLATMETQISNIVTAFQDTDSGEALLLLTPVGKQWYARLSEGIEFQRFQNGAVFELTFFTPLAAGEAIP
jgi:hypothetical protein